ncbi:hypothetical protein NFI95_09805 [Acetobacteraceae bacterium KSS8]|uniref:NADH:quinone oxidoreductase/Mrp antiporter membrane subunit domain-containing protein n=1 Tax=Endosaccharibacter trunci TaxID=2812733 RepID=A0ABT1W9H2_9PROT|nr:hypothetical protein [Acetobacteraceae bacterium KSS8]
MSVLVPPVIWLPFVLALMPLALPEGVSPRRLAQCAVWVAGLTLLLAGWASLAPTVLLCGTGLWWRGDALARTMTLLPALSWFLVSVRALQPGEAARQASARWRRWPVSAQLIVACAMAICRADLLALLPLFLGVMLFAGRREPTDEREAALVLGAVPVTGAGVAVLSSATGMPARWSGLVAASHPVSSGLLLLLLPILLLCAWAALRPVLFGRATVSRGLFRLLVLSVGLLVTLRCLGAVPALAPLVSVTGLLLGASAVLLLPAQRSLAGRVSLAAALQSAFALVAAASGGAGGVAASLMLAGSLALLLPLILFVPADRSAARLRFASILVLIGLPPFGPFAAFMVLMLRLTGTSPALAALLLLGAAVSALAVLRSSGRDPVAVLPEGRTGAWGMVSALCLLLSLWLGLAMPNGLSDWLLSVGGSGR